MIGDFLENNCLASTKRGSDLSGTLTSQVASAAIRSSSALLIFSVYDLTCRVGKWCVVYHQLSGTIQVLLFCPNFTIFKDPSAKQFVENV